VLPAAAQQLGQFGHAVTRKYVLLTTSTGLRLTCRSWEQKVPPPAICHLSKPGYVITSPFSPGLNVLPLADSFAILNSKPTTYY